MTDSRPNCEYEDDVAAYVQGELSAPRAADLRAHLPRCAPCRAQVEDTRRVLAVLGARPSGARTAPARRPVARRPLAAAALLALSVLTVATWDTWRGGDASGPHAGPILDATPAPSDAAWLGRGLTASGTWTDVLDAAPARRTSLHALALLALCRGSGDGVDPRPAALWLLRQQDADGAVGAGLDNGATDQLLGTLALAASAQRTGAADLRAAAASAAARLVDEMGRRRLHPAQLAWADDALDAARELGIEGVPEARRRVLFDDATRARSPGGWLAHAPSGAGDPSREQRGATLGALHAASHAVLVATRD